MCCFGPASASPPLHSRADFPVPPRVITILPTTYSSNPGTAAMPTNIDLYTHRAHAPTLHSASALHYASHHASHEGGLVHHEKPRVSPHQRDSNMHHAGEFGGFGGGPGYGGGFGRYR